MTTTEAVAQFEQDYDLIGVEMVKQLVAELQGQGHVATGALMRSIVESTQTMFDEIETSISHLEYGETLNTGVPASKVPRFGADYGNLLFALVKWIRFKKLAFGADKAYRFARNIINKAQQTGFPTPGSYRFSKNSRRKGWIDYVVATYQLSWEEKASDISFELVDNYLEAQLQAIANRYKNISIS